MHKTFKRIKFIKKYISRFDFKVYESNETEILIPQGKY